MSGVAVEVRILDARLHEWGLPRYHSDAAAAIDLHACLDGETTIAPGDPALLISAGFALHMADPHMAALVLPRSGMGHKRGLVLGNLVGLIDPRLYRADPGQRVEPRDSAGEFGAGGTFRTVAVRADLAARAARGGGVFAEFGARGGRLWFHWLRPTPAARRAGRSGRC